MTLISLKQDMLKCIILNMKSPYLYDLCFIRWAIEWEEFVFKRNPNLFLQSLPLKKKNK